MFNNCTQVNGSLRKTDLKVSEFKNVIEEYDCDQAVSGQVPSYLGYIATYGSKGYGHLTRFGQK